MNQPAATDRGDAQTPPRLHCADCGYDLRGLQTDGECPECGLSITESIVGRGGFTRHQLALLACRMLALWVLVHMSVTLAESARGLTWSFQMQGFVLAGWVAAFAPLCINLAFAALLWFGGPWIARRIFADDAPVRIGGRAGVWDLLVLAPLGVGVVFVAIGGQAAVWFITALVLTQAPYDYIEWALYASSYLLAGSVLLLGGPAIVRGIKRLRTAGQGPTSS